jgi:hypothetical protein|nr:MAG TPA: hypothetical protein [Caudoviricetes sp.]
MSVATIALVVALAGPAATGLVLTRILADLRDVRKAWARTEMTGLDHGLRLTVTEKHVADLKRGARELSAVVGMIDRDVQDMTGAETVDHEARCLGCRACMRGDCD